MRFILQHTVDVTELHLLRQSVPSSWQIETDVLRRADAVQGENLALGREREYLRSLFEQAPGFMAVLHGKHHVFEIANAAYLDLVGRREIIGRTVREALPDLEGQGFYELLDQVFETGEPYRAFGAKVALQRSENVGPDERFVDFVFQPVRDANGLVTGIFVQGNDVTDLRQAQEAARESENRFRSLAQALPNHVWTATAEGILDWCNLPMLTYLGVDDIAGRRDIIETMLHPDDSDRVWRMWAEAIDTGRSFQAEMRLRCAEGNFRWHISRAVAIANASGDIIRWVGTNTDIEDQKKTESRLETLASTLENRWRSARPNC